MRFVRTAAARLLAVAMVAALGVVAVPGTAQAAATNASASLTNAVAGANTGATVTWSTSTGWASIIVQVQLTGFSALNTYGATTPCPFTLTVAGSTSVGGCTWSSGVGYAYFAAVVTSGGLGNAASSLTIPAAYLRAPASAGSYQVAAWIDQTGQTTPTTANVSVAASTDASLSNLAMSAGAITPSFAAGTTSYTSSVTNGVASTTVTPTANSGGATITVNGSSVASGAASGSIALAVGDTTITTVVTAQDGTTTRSYTIVVTRAASADAELSGLSTSSGSLDPAFAAATTTYVVAVGESVEVVTVTATTSSGVATLRINGVVTVSGVASAPIAVSPGVTTITVLVTAQDSSTLAYTLRVSRPIAAPPSWYQAYARQAPGELCLEGWAPSWDWWPHSGLGGPTCERRVEWSWAKAAWVTFAGFSG